jgi:hypothetical protein
VPVGRDLGGIRVPLGIQHPPVSGYFPKTKWVSHGDTSSLNKMC